MSINRKKDRRDGGFTVMDNDLFHHRRMSLKAKGLLGYFLTMPDNWEFRVRQLIKVLPEGKAAIYSTMHELERFGYLTKEQPRFKNGEVDCVVYTVHEESIGMQEVRPLPENRQADKFQIINNKIKKENVNNCDFLQQDGGGIDVIPGIDLDEWQVEDIERCDFTDADSADIGDEACEIEEVKIYPAKHQPRVRSDAMLKHCVKTESLVENTLGPSLTTKQAVVVRDVAEYFAPCGGADELGEWIGNSLVNPDAFSNCRGFLHKMNAIIGKVRQGDYSKPFKLRYEEMPIAKSAPQSPEQSFKGELRRLELQAFSYKTAINTCRAFPELAAMHQKSLAELEAKIRALQNKVAQMNDKVAA